MSGSKAQDGGQDDEGHKVFFDISGVVTYINKIDRYSGIQRVVVTLIVETATLVSPDRLYLSWRDKSTGRYQCLPFAQIGPGAFASPESMRKIFRPAAARRDQFPALKKYRSRPVKYLIHRTWLDLMSLLGRDRHFRKYDMTARMWRDMRKSRAAGSAQKIAKQPIAQIAARGDHLVLLDSAWQPEQMEIFATVKQSGLRIHAMVYDLIPIIAPQTCDNTIPAFFYDWLLRSLDYVDCYMTISQATRTDLLTFFAAHDVPASATAVPLAQAALPGSAEMGGGGYGDGPLSAAIATQAYPRFKEMIAIEDSLRHIVAAPYVLCVGTIEARKNVWRIALAWKALLEQGHTDLPKLVFAGRRGWLRGDFEDFLQGTGNLYGYISVLDGPSDQELHMLYQHCTFSIMASLYEGWGLPVGEALAYGKTAVVADNSSLPEVGGDLVEYCDAHSVSSIAAAIERLLDPGHRAMLEARIAATDLRSWQDVAKDLLAALTRPERASKG